MGETITEYNKLKDDPHLIEIWTVAFGKEFESLAQGNNKTGAKDMQSLFVMDPADAHNTPKDRIITFGRIDVVYHEQKDDPN